MRIQKRKQKYRRQKAPRVHRLKPKRQASTVKAKCYNAVAKAKADINGETKQLYNAVAKAKADTNGETKAIKRKQKPRITGEIVVSWRRNSGKTLCRERFKKRKKHRRVIKIRETNSKSPEKSNVILKKRRILFKVRGERIPF